MKAEVARRPTRMRIVKASSSTGFAIESTLNSSSTCRGPGRVAVPLMRVVRRSELQSHKTLHAAMES